jgi:hypothetical protein
MGDVRSAGLGQRRLRKDAIGIVGSLFLLIAGCGGRTSGAGPAPGPIPGENTTVAIQLSSTANDQFTRFGMGISQITLVNKAGKVVSIYTGSPASIGTPADFMSWNGLATPFATVSVPQDIYTSAAVTISGPYFEYIFTDAQQSLNFATDAYQGGYGPAPVVNLPEPITVSGAAIGLTLNLEAAQSATLSALAQNASYSISPVFQLTPFVTASSAANPGNGKCAGLDARVTAIDATANTVTLNLAGYGQLNQVATSPTLTVALNASTQYQGIASATGLAVGDFVDTDLALQSDGSYLATRIELKDASAKDMLTGLVAQDDPLISDGLLSAFPTSQQGDDLSTEPVGAGYAYQPGSATTFQISGQVTNLGSLPFSAVFNAANLVPGQRISFGSPSIAYTTAAGYTVPTTMTLVPQTIDATVNAVSTSGNYTVYAVSLAPYDPVVQLNVPTPQYVDKHIANANVVNVYVDSNTSLLNSNSLATGGTFRFHGLLFNDNGVFRMVTDQVTDGVPQ